MNIRVFEHDMQAAQAAAFLLASQILEKPDSVLALPTGSTPVPVYKELAHLTASGILDWSRVTTFNLDEYLGLAADDEQSYHHFMHEQLFSKINMRPEQIHILDGMAADPEAECLAYERAIRGAGGIDLAFLGIGRNGHIGFNEPTEIMSAMTHVVDLTAETLADNARFFTKNQKQPTQAMSMGIGTIMQARQIVLVATGGGKARAVRQMICGSMDPQIPASILQIHKSVTIFLDRAAAAALKANCD